MALNETIKGFAKNIGSLLLFGVASIVVAAILYLVFVQLVPIAFSYVLSFFVLLYQLPFVWVIFEFLTVVGVVAAVAWWINAPTVAPVQMHFAHYFTIVVALLGMLLATLYWAFEVVAKFAFGLLLGGGFPWPAIGFVAVFAANVVLPAFGIYGLIWLLRRYALRS